MNDTKPGRSEALQPSDPDMAASDPGMFAALTYQEDVILYDHLYAGGSKQSAVYEPLSELWKDTNATLDDLLDARKAALAAQIAALQAEREPEAGS